jgi:hypothetical protein
MTTITTTRSRPAAAPAVRRLLVVAMGGLLVVDLVGGLWAGLSGANTWADAWGGHALLAAPVPMIVAQLLTTWAAVRGRRRRAAVPAGLLAVACLLSVMSGFFDGGLGNPALRPGMAAYQVFLLGVTGLVGVLAALRAAQLARR